MKRLRSQMAVVAMFLVAALASTAASCPGGQKNPEVIVGQAGLGIAQSISQLQTATKQLSIASVIEPAVAIGIQERLLKVNELLKPLPDLLRTVDSIRQAGGDATGTVDRIVAILREVGNDLSVTFAGVPLVDAAEPLFKLVRAAHDLVTTTLLEVAKVRGEAQ